MIAALRGTLEGLTADQFDRPQRNLVVGGPVFMDIPPEKTWTPQDPLATVTRDENDQPRTVITYRPIPPGLPVATQWRQSPDWTQGEEDLRDLARGIARQLQQDESDPERADAESR